MVDLMSKNKKWCYFLFSLLVMLPGLVIMLIFGLRLGIDFVGGTLLEYKFEKRVTARILKEEISKKDTEVSTINPSGENTFIIKTKPLAENKIGEIKNQLSEKFGKVEELRVETVGPVVGAETARNAFWALIIASLMIVLYLALVFRKVPKPASSLRFGIAAVVALLHDVLVVLGIFAILGVLFNVEIDVLFVTALLTVIGFSVHDTIVVFDRIRENLPKHLSKSFTEVANIAIVQTLARSLNTSLTVVFVLLSLLLFGGETIKWFVVALLVGVISGTYSSIFNATALLVLWEEKLRH